MNMKGAFQFLMLGLGAAILTTAVIVIARPTERLVSVEA